MNNFHLSNFDLSQGVGLPYSSCTYNQPVRLFVLRTFVYYVVCGISSVKNGSYGTWLYFLADVDECSLKTHDCDSNAICNNTGGSFTCKCDGNALYYGDGKTCSHHRKRTVTYFILKLMNALMLILWIICNALPLHFVTLTTLLSMLTNEVVSIQRR